MKKVVSLLIGIILIIGISGCTDSKESNKDDNSNVQKIDNELLSQDVKNAKAIRTGVEVSLCSEDIFCFFTEGVEDSKGALIEIKADSATIADALIINGVSEDYSCENTSYEDMKATIINELENSMSGVPKINYKGQLDGSSDELGSYYAYIDKKTQVVTVYIAPSGKTLDEILSDATGDGIYQLSPTVCEEYKDLVIELLNE